MVIRRRLVAGQLAPPLLLLLLLLVALAAVAVAAAVAPAEGRSRSSSSSSQRTMKLGILLDEQNDQELANMFMRTIKMINELNEDTIRALAINYSAAWEPDNSDTPSPSLGGVSRRSTRWRLEPSVELLRDKNSALEADEKACQLLESGARLLVGPSSGQSIGHVQSICDRLELPYVELRPNDQLRRQSTERQLDEPLTLNLFPASRQLNLALVDLIGALNWSSFAIVYERAESLVKLQELFKEPNSRPPAWTNRWQIKLFRLDDAPPASAASRTNSSSNHWRPPDQVAAAAAAAEEPEARRHSRATYRDVFWRLKMSGERNIVLDVPGERLHEALKQSQQVGCMTEGFSYIVTSLDLHTVDLEDFRYSRVKLLGFSLLQLRRRHLPPDESPPNQSAGFFYWQHSTSSDGGGGRHHSRPLAFTDLYLEALGLQRPSKWAAKGQRENSTEQAASWAQWTSQEAQWQASNKREQLESSPLSLRLLPPANDEREQKLFELLVQQQRHQLQLTPGRLTTSMAILHDSLLLYWLALNQLELSTDSVGQLGCEHNSAPLHYGSSLVNFMRRLTFRGLTGELEFDKNSGVRTNFVLNLLGLAPNLSLIKVAEWHSSRGTGQLGNEVAKDAHQQQQQQQQSAASAAKKEQQNATLDGATGATKLVEVPYAKCLEPSSGSGSSAAGSLCLNEVLFDRLYRDQTNQMDTLIVTAKLSQPYFMLKETPNKLDGNDQFEGYAVDLIHELSKLVNFKYKWREVADKKYGSKEVYPNGTVEWNGMIGEIVRGTADLAIVDLTITAQREEAVDFTLPFMNTGISILFKKPTTKVTTLFSFLSPFSSDVWAYVLAAYCGISAILFVVGHLSPYEWSDPHPCRHFQQMEAERQRPAAALSQDDRSSVRGPAVGRPVLRNQFSLLNSFWFTIGSLMQQGSDLTPRSMSTRTIAGIWYFFTLIMISSYTANLAAFLTVEKVVYPIENVRDLSQQQEIKYGCVESGSTCMFFHDSQIGTYKKINETMHKYHTYVRSNDEGQKRVGEGKFAFFMESTTIEYIVERNCNLTQIGGLIDSKGYGLATSKHSRHKRPYRTLLNEGILHLQETGMLHVLKNRWWKEKRGGGTCTDDGKGSGVTELSLANVGGVFVVLLGGLGISFLVAIAEFMWRARRNGSSRDLMCDEMMSDLKFALACKSSTKPKSGNVAKAIRISAPDYISASNQRHGPPSMGHADQWPHLFTYKRPPPPVLNNGGPAPVFQAQPQQQADIVWDRQPLHALTVTPRALRDADNYKFCQNNNNNNDLDPPMIDADENDAEFLDSNGQYDGETVATVQYYDHAMGNAAHPNGKGASSAKIRQSSDEWLRRRLLMQTQAQTRTFDMTDND